MQKKIHLFYKDFKIYFIAIATLFGFMAFQEFINFEKITTIISILYVLVLTFINRKFLEND
ncbi:hypothetical protein OAH37_03905 [Acidimicrobiia bacterium]|jgi:hypothetical protein|nr:hypothetical protein [Acidimicrobiia bacterium]|tara:strand:+ start:58 stop:240 length:183 start_codon:yes stop_codon:yes gene_type:complete